MFEDVPESLDFVKVEENVLELWKECDTFHSCLTDSQNNERFTFFDGPPFATGLPHYGHILAGTVKDIICRYAHQSGYHVERRFGWDCHGLPVEYEIDKRLNITGPADVERLGGVAVYNNECRKIVTRYATEWRHIVERLGRWIDFDNDYKTMYPTYMESVWWVFKQLYEKGLVYRGTKVMPYSTACCTPLSNFEAGQNYREVNDPAIIVKFPLEAEPDVCLLAWTTTPWTLPSNLALCVRADSQYVRVQCEGATYIVMESRLAHVFKAEWRVLDRFPGSRLQSLSYVPLFDYFRSWQHERGAFRVLCDNYVTADSGTGIVHQAPYFGEDDYRVCAANDIVRCDDRHIVCPVDERGCFTQPVADFAGVYVKDADRSIIQRLKSQRRLFDSSKCRHNYPFCWRSDTPLLYKAVPSWFVRAQQLRTRMLANNKLSNWVPAYVKENRFANWLADARDWAVSRNRYWGTPLPLWVSADYSEVLCVGSVEELARLSGVTITDLHRESIDNIEIPSRANPDGPPLRRVAEVFDCWFESGSMPYAQVHYPFSCTHEQFMKRFPANFVAEGIDQTRGWFYTMLVLATGLFDQTPYLNLICHGLVLAADGQKMSKRKKNYPDPMHVVDKYGADSLRLYLINSPVVRGDCLRFNEKGVHDILKDVLIPWYNAFRFFVLNMKANRKLVDTAEFCVSDASQLPADNLMDRWIVSYTQSLLSFVNREMLAYRLYTVVPKLIAYINQLTNCYVRLNRRRLRNEISAHECLQSLRTLSHVVLTMCRLLAPFTPFLCEHMYQCLRRLLPSQTCDSVHRLARPQACERLCDQQLEQNVALMQTVIELGRVIRERNVVALRYPLHEAIVLVQSEAQIAALRTLETYIREQLNVRLVVMTTDRHKYGAQVYVEPNHRQLGPRFKTRFGQISEALRALNDEEVSRLIDEGTLTVCGESVSVEDVYVKCRVSSDPPVINLACDPESAQSPRPYESHYEGGVMVLLDMNVTEDLEQEGVAREVINRVQKMRKTMGLVPADRVTCYYKCSCYHSHEEEGHGDLNLYDVLRKKQQYIADALNIPFVVKPGDFKYCKENTVNTLKTVSEVRNNVLKLILVRH